MPNKNEELELLLESVDKKLAVLQEQLTSIEMDVRIMLTEAGAVREDCLSMTGRMASLRMSAETLQQETEKIMKAQRGL